MEPDDNVLELGADDNLALLATLLSDYEHCNERRRCAIRRFARKLAEMDSPHHPGAKILHFPSA